MNRRVIVGGRAWCPSCGVAGYPHAAGCLRAVTPCPVRTCYIDHAPDVSCADAYAAREDENNPGH